jgi:hypothetical protein
MRKPAETFIKEPCCNTKQQKPFCSFEAKKAIQLESPFVILSARFYNSAGETENDD